MADHRTEGSRTAIYVEDPILNKIVTRLVDTDHPERIYLYGSRGRGDSGPDSDYDLMVVVSDDAPRLLRRAAPAYEALWELHTAVDVLVWTRDAFDSRLHLRASLPSTVKRDGRLVYSA